MQRPASISNSAPSFGALVRNSFALQRDYAHLNHGSYGATPVSVLAAQRIWQDKLELEPSRFMRRDYKPAMRAAIAALAPRLGIGTDGLALVENATQAVNAVLRELDLPDGAGILVTDQTYGAVRNAARHMSERKGWNLRSVTLPFPAASAEEILAAYTAALEPAPALVILDHITSPTALVLPLTQMAEAARARGALVLVDGAHAPGMLDLDLSAVPCDWYTGNLHKWMFTPKGCGFLWTAEARRETTHPLAISHWYQEGYDAEFEYVGTRDASSQLCLPTALEFVDAHGIDAIRAHNNALVNEAADALAARWGTERGAGPGLTGHMAMVRLPDGFGSTREEAEALRDRLTDEFRVQVPVNPLTGTLWCRLSAQIYNEMTDYDRLAAAVERLAG
ncbi:aminotransferase class V-fold PLP-dependent enzyme [Nisaea sp.]|uniref:aminotransferase class V-fold PLP-dependent enzyme n=1 Tax=Nisaea sp. TaxID=2024842 RepID=UPI003B52A6CF